jgi:hypothetical protein
LSARKVRAPSRDFCEAVVEQRRERFAVEFAGRHRVFRPKPLHHLTAALTERTFESALPSFGLTLQRALRRARAGERARVTRRSARRAHRRADVHQREQTVATRKRTRDRDGSRFRLALR